MGDQPVAAEERSSDGGEGRQHEGPRRRTEREDFQATSDPALQESADRGKVKLLDYRELYLLWERQQWLTQDLDFSQDRIDWHERIPEEERFQRMYGLSSFFIGEQKVADELGPIMRAAPTETQRIFLATQIADEARHVRFFDRFFSEVGVLEGADELPQRLEALEVAPNPAFDELFDDLLKSRVDRLAQEPGDLDGPDRGGDALPHGHRGHARPQRPALHHRLQRARAAPCRASSRASPTSPATSIATSPSASAS